MVKGTDADVFSLLLRIESTECPGVENETPRAEIIGGSRVPGCNCAHCMIKSQGILQDVWVGSTFLCTCNGLWFYLSQTANNPQVTTVSKQ